MPTLHVYTSRFSAGVPAPLVAWSAGLLPVSSFATSGGLPESFWPGVCEYSRGEIHRAGRCGRIKDRKSARCHCLLLTMTTTKTSHRPASVASSPPLLAFFEALFWTVMAFIKERWPALRCQARQRRKGGGEGALPHRRSSGLQLFMSPTLPHLRPSCRYIPILVQCMRCVSKGRETLVRGRQRRRKV